VADPIRRVVVGVHGSAGSLRALRRGVAEARLREVPVWSVRAWTPPGGEDVDRRCPCPDLTAYWQEHIQEELRATWQDALGGLPPDLVARLLAVRGPAGRSLALLTGPDDLLVLGTGQRTHHFGHGAVTRYCLAHAGCCVLVVPASPLDRHLPRWGPRYRRMIRELTS